MRDPDREILALKHSIDRLISLLEQEAGIIARSEPSSRLERLLAQIDRLTLALEAANHKLETASETQFRQLVDRPEVNREERNTRSDYQDANDE